MLNIYAFCNTHDITWGTKGDDKAEKLPSANLKPGGKVDVNIPQDDGDLNAQYEAELVKFASKPPKEENTVSEEDRQADYYKGFRSAVVLVWVFCNFALAAVVLSAAGLEEFSSDQETTENTRATIYMAVVLWSVAGLSLFKFMGAMWFLTVRMVSLPEPKGVDSANEGLVPRCLIWRSMSRLRWTDKQTDSIPLQARYGMMMTSNDGFMIHGAMGYPVVDMIDSSLVYVTYDIIRAS